MKLAVSYDGNGRILGLFDPGTLSGEKGSMRYLPKPGERHFVIEIGEEFEGKSLLDIHKSMRVNTSGAEPRLEPSV